MLARFDSKEAFPEKKKLDINMLMQGVIKNIKGISELKELSVVFEPADEVILDADEGQLKTLFFNILDNAVKYTPLKGEVRISVEKDRSFAKIKIEDTGVGISEENIGHVFDRFYRVDRSRNHSGFGLGLSIARSIVEAHGGTIEVESVHFKGLPDVANLDQTHAMAKSGTIFTITLPLG